MKTKHKNAFTLIELIAVLVILAVIALIVSPLVLNIVKKVRDSANKRSIDAYGRATELSIAGYMLENGGYPNTLDDLTVEYSGNTVICNVRLLNEDGSIYLSECSVAGKEVRDKNAEDGWYHYGKKQLTNKEYVDIYGKALEEAVEEYKILNNSLPSDYKTLDISYDGKTIECDVTINVDGSIFLTKCSVDKVGVKDASANDGWYHYGKKKFKTYNIGDKVTYNGMDFYVIAFSDESNDSVTLLKAEPLTVDEVNTYGAGYINKYTEINKGIAGNYNNNGYGGMTYYSSETCGYIDGVYITDGCTTDYDELDVKYAVDAWAVDKFAGNHLKKDNLGYKARLLTYDELFNNLQCVSNSCSSSPYNSWIYNSKYYYLTMSQYEDSFDMWGVYYYGYVGSTTVCKGSLGVVRPVVTILKFAI